MGDQAVHVPTVKVPTLPGDLQELYRELKRWERHVSGPLIFHDFKADAYRHAANLLRVVLLTHGIPVPDDHSQG